MGWPEYIYLAIVAIGFLGIIVSKESPLTKILHFVMMGFVLFLLDAGGFFL